MCIVPLRNYDFEVLIVTNKGLLIAATAVGLCGLMLVQMPFLSLIYFIKGGCKAHPDLPYYYMRLMMTVSCPREDWESMSGVPNQQSHWPQRDQTPQHGHSACSCVLASQPLPGLIWSRASLNQPCKIASSERGAFCRHPRHDDELRSGSLGRPSLPGGWCPRRVWASWRMPSPTLWASPSSTASPRSHEGGRRFFLLALLANCSGCLMFCRACLSTIAMH